MNISMYVDVVRTASGTWLLPNVVWMGALSALLLFAALVFAIGAKGQHFYTQSAAVAQEIPSGGRIAHASRVESALRGVMWVMLSGGIVLLAAVGVGLSALL